MRRKLVPVRERLRPSKPWVRLVAAALALASCDANPTSDPDMTRPNPAHPLAGARLCGFAATIQPERCRAFYEGLLGLRLVSDDALALVFELEGQMLRVQKLREHRPQSFTVLGWNVRELRRHVAALSERGVEFVRVEGFGQDEHGIVRFPDGTELAWMRDPDGNVLSLAQIPGW